MKVVYMRQWYLSILEIDGSVDGVSMYSSRAQTRQGVMYNLTEFVVPHSPLNETGYQLVLGFVRRLTLHFILHRIRLMIPTVIT
jgi:hypothetical protein